MSETKNEVAGNTIPPPRSSRSFCFTAYDTPTLTHPYIRYAVYQKEICPITKKLHYQGYLELTMPEKLSWLKKYISETAHFERRRGTRDEARNYCMKQESQAEPPVEFGTWIKGQGNRSDLSEIAEEIKNGATELDIVDNFPETYIKFCRGLKAVYEIRAKANTNNFRNLEVIILWGEAGVGKTRFVYDHEPISKIYKLDCNSEAMWFDGYSQEPVLLLDDFYGNIKYSYLLNLLDIYPLRLPIKCGHTYANWNKVYITSNKPPEQWYSTGYTAALRRRITSIIHLEAHEQGNQSIDSARGLPLTGQEALSGVGLLAR